MLGVALSSTACASLPEASTPLGIAGAATPPQGFVQFCERQPVDCGVTAVELDGMRLAASQSVTSPAVAAISFDWRAAFAEQRRRREATDLAAPPQLQQASLTYDWNTAFAQDRSRRDAVTLVADQARRQPGRAVNRAGASSGRIPLSAKTWAMLTSTNDTINRSIAQRSDFEVYGVPELWATPLESGRRVGDCEDYALEKRRALVAAGLPASSLSIAVVITDRRETHAVLLVATEKGEYVLDSLSAWVLPWAKTGYEWRERQVAGSASNWAFAAGPAIDQPASPGLLLASLH